MLKLHNSLTRKLEPFEPLKKGEVTMYHCGPTVYDYVHIGNLRAFLFADLLRRFFEHRGFKVRQVMNITDVGHMLADADVGEDKMEAAAKKEQKTPQEVAAFYTEAFFRDIDRLGVRHAHVYPKASEHVPEMIALIQKLLDAGHAYRTADGSVYFDVMSFPNYGRLSGNTLDRLDAGSRVEVREEKRHPADFALWIVNPNHLMQWDAPWSRGYPGWHVECSAMSMKYLGETIDLHTGGEDNKFPHHECEIAQAEGATGRPFVRTWLHVTHLLVDGDKMSKSKGNFYTLDDLLAKGWQPREVRFLLLQAHYRQSFNFTFAGLESARAALARLDDFADALRSFEPAHLQKGQSLSQPKGSVPFATKRVSPFLAALEAALDDDLNTAAAWAAVFDAVRAVNEKLASGRLTKDERDAALKMIDILAEIFGFTFGRTAAADAIPPVVADLIAERDRARQEKRFADSDRLRNEIRAQGYLVEDTPAGRRIKRL